MSVAVDTVEVFFFERPRAAPYLGAGEDEVLLDNRYLVRKFNGTVYPLTDCSIVVRVVDKAGVVGWGETYGLIAPKAVAAIIFDLLAPYLKQCTFDSPAQTWDALYALQRNRGYWGGYLADAIAALDIAIWDMHSRSEGKSIQAGMGRPGAGKLAGYVSGLPSEDKAGRLAMAQEWKSKGFDLLKIPASHTDNGDMVGEFDSLRSGLGADHKIALDMHWKFTAEEAIAIAASLEPFDPWFLEAPVAPEDVAAQRSFAKTIRAPAALGEEWRTDWDYLARTDCCAIIQPEMGHTGITQFQRMAKRAKANGAKIIPHATIGLGIFMSASLRAGLAVSAEAHEFQHTIYTRNAALLNGAAPCTNGYFEIPDTPGHGLTPTSEAFDYLTQLQK